MPEVSPGKRFGEKRAAKERARRNDSEKRREDRKVRKETTEEKGLDDRMSRGEARKVSKQKDEKNFFLALADSHFAFCRIRRNLRFDGNASKPREKSKVGERDHCLQIGASWDRNR